MDKAYISENINEEIRKEIYEELKYIKLDDSDESLKLLNDFLERISTVNRKIFVMRYYHLYEISHIARDMDVNVNTVKNSLLRTCGELEAFIQSRGTVDCEQLDTNDILVLINRIDTAYIAETREAVDKATASDVDENNNKVAHRKYSRKQLVGIFVAVMVVLSVAIALISMSLSGVDNKNKQLFIAETFDIPFSDTLGLDNSGDVSTEESMSDIFPTVQYNGRTYCATGYDAYGEIFINKILAEEYDCIPPVILEDLLSGHEVEVCKYVTYTTKIYSIKAISSEYMIGVEHIPENGDSTENDDDVTLDDSEVNFNNVDIYLAKDYCPETLGQLYTDFYISDYSGLNYRDAYYYHNRSDVSASQIIYFEDSIVNNYAVEILLDEPEKMICLNNSMDINESDYDFIIALNFSYMAGTSFNNTYVYITEDGMMLFDFLGSHYWFDIGSERVTEFLDKITRYCDMCEVTYFPEP